MGDIAKAVLRNKFLELNAYIKKEEKFQINNLCSHHKEVQKEQN